VRPEKTLADEILHGRARSFHYGVMHETVADERDDLREILAEGPLFPGNCRFTTSSSAWHASKEIHWKRNAASGSSFSLSDHFSQMIAL
jgi:hypothetical protein